LFYNSDGPSLAPLHKKYNTSNVLWFLPIYHRNRCKSGRAIENEYAGVQGEMAYKYPIHRNAIPQCDVFEENGYTKKK
jgi:aspartate-semialdehyde dehydrogenase